MEELDKLKQDWKRKENSFSQFSEQEIYKMLHRQSSSIVKWILIISIIEVTAWTAISCHYSTDEYLKSLNHGELSFYFNIVNWLNYTVIVVFIYLFYRNYVNISTTSTTKQLMKDIIKTRHTVQYYVWFNLLMIVLSLITGFVLAFLYNPEIGHLKESMESKWTYMAMAIGLLIVAITVIVTLFWLVYRLLYGILLRKLLLNYSELKKINL